MQIKFGCPVKKYIISNSSSRSKGHEQGCINTDSDNRKKKNKVAPAAVHTPGGFVPVYIGLEHKRYEVPSKCINSYRFQAFLNQHEEDILAFRDEPITLLCSTNVFETILTLAKADTKVIPHS